MEYGIVKRTMMKMDVGVLHHKAILAQAIKWVVLVVAVVLVTHTNNSNTNSNTNIIINNNNKHSNNIASQDNIFVMPLEYTASQHNASMHNKFGRFHSFPDIALFMTLII